MNENLPAKIVNIEDYSMTAALVIKQATLIQDVMRSVMKEGEHYGTIPGVEKPSLYKPGAEKLSVTFRLVPKYEGERSPINLPNGHREYIITCSLYHAPTGQFFGQGVGSCSTMESRYRYRADYEFTGKVVPKEYWAKRDSSLLGGKSFVAKKNPENGRWEIVKKGDRTENPDIADTYNTVLKMAKKRAHVDAVLTATAASDIFTQDIEDLHSKIAEEEIPEDKGGGDISGTPRINKIYSEAINKIIKAFAGIGILEGEIEDLLKHDLTNVSEDERKMLLAVYNEKSKKSPKKKAQPEVQTQTPVETLADAKYNESIRPDLRLAMDKRAWPVERRRDWLVSLGMVQPDRMTDEQVRDCLATLEALKVYDSTTEKDVSL